LALKIHKECLPAQGWVVLKKLHSVISAHGFILAGGTALAIRKGHRTSFDLDFFTPDKFRNDNLITEIKKKAVNFQLLSEGEGSLTLNVEDVKVSFFKYEYPFLDDILDIEQTRVAGILDIAAMKVIAIIQRGTKRDFVDLYTILQETPFHRVADHMIRRFGKERINPVHIGKSFVYFSDADTNPDPAYRKGTELKWEDIKKFFRQHVKQFVLDLDAARKDESAE
jgi:predicted nucleotidyltransferase component of viral defense system